MVYLAADKGRITAAMDKWEDHGGSRVIYEFKIKIVLIELKAKPSVRT